MAILGRVSSIPIKAKARRNMIDDLTNRVRSASTGTRILAPGLNACLIGRAVGTGYTFWSASFVRITEVVFYADARSGAIVFFTDGVVTARRWHAWV